MSGRNRERISAGPIAFLCAIREPSDNALKPRQSPDQALRQLKFRHCTPTPRYAFIDAASAAWMISQLLHCFSNWSRLGAAQRVETSLIPHPGSFQYLANGCSKETFPLRPVRRQPPASTEHENFQNSAYSFCPPFPHCLTGGSI